MYIKEEIIEELANSAAAVTSWITYQSEDRFIKGPPGKWNTSQHLDHLHQVVVLINKVLRIPKFILRWRFGKPNRKGRDYEAIVARYKEKLKGFVGTNNPTGGKTYPVEEKSKQLSDFQLQIQRLQKVLGKWSEEELDKYLIPHPLLGKLTVRELILWMVYHHYHHLDNLKTNY